MMKRRGLAVFGAPWHPVPEGDPNAELRAAAFAALDEAFAGLPLGRAGVTAANAVQDGLRPA